MLSHAEEEPNGACEGWTCAEQMGEAVGDYAETAKS